MPVPPPTPSNPSSPSTGPSLTDRYLHRAVRGLPAEQRADLADELRATIADRVEALRAERPELTEERAEYAAVQELGDPARLAASYAGHGLHLIGPELYPGYVRVLRSVLSVALPGVAAVFVALDAFAGEGVGAIVGHAVWMTFTVGVQICFWITLVFALAERGGAPGADARASLGADWTPEQLPTRIEPRIGLCELIANLSFLALITGAIVWQQFRSPFEVGGEPVPLLDPDLWAGWLPLILALLLAEAAFEVVKYRLGGWSPRLAGWNVALGALFAAPVVWLAATDRLMNPVYVDRLRQDWTGFDAGIAHTVVLVTALAIWAWDSVDGWRKALADR